MKQYRVTYQVDTGEGTDCVLGADDPLHTMKEEMFLGNVPGVDTYLVYPEPQSIESDEKINPYSQV
jgi:hypothetical protein